MKWVSLKERKPSIEDYCGFRVVYYTDGNQYASSHDNFEPTHWIVIDIPPLPKEEKPKDMYLQSRIPEFIPTFEETSKQMLVNVDILKKKITDHVDGEIQRLIQAKNCCNKEEKPKDEDWKKTNTGWYHLEDKTPPENTPIFYRQNNILKKWKLADSNSNEKDEDWERLKSEMEYCDRSYDDETDFTYKKINAIYEFLKAKYGK